MANKWVTVQIRGLTDDTMGRGLYKKFSLICLFFFPHEVFSALVQINDTRFPSTPYVDISGNVDAMWCLFLSVCTVAYKGIALP